MTQIVSHAETGSSGSMLLLVGLELAASVVVDWLELAFSSSDRK